MLLKYVVAAERWDGNAGPQAEAVITKLLDTERKITK
jgi:hypothetical protein